MPKKNNALILKIILSLVVVIIVAIFAAGGFYVLTGWRLDTVEATVKRIKETDLLNIEGDLDYHDDRLYEQEKEVFGVKKEIGYLNEKVDRNYKVQEQILKEIKTLHQ